MSSKQNQKKQETSTPEIIETGSYDAGVIDFTGTERRFEVPYEAIKKTLEKGGVYVMPKSFNGEPLSDYTVKNALRRIRKEVPEANIGYTNTDENQQPTANSQVVYYVPKSKGA